MRDADRAVLDAIQAKKDAEKAEREYIKKTEEETAAKAEREKRKNEAEEKRLKSEAEA